MHERSIVGAMLLWLVTACLPAQSFATSLEVAEECIEAKEWKEAFEILIGLQEKATTDDERDRLAKRLFDLGEALRSVAQYGEALRAHELALDERRQLHGDRDDPDVAMSLNNSAMCRQSMGRAASALPQFEQALAMWKRMKGDAAHPAVAMGLNNVGWCLASVGREDEALKSYEQALEMFRRVHGNRDHADVAVSLNNVAACLKSLGRPSEALAFCEQALAMRQRIHGEGNNTAVATSLNQLASCLQALGRTTEALRHYEKALEIRVRSYGNREHPDVAQSLNNVAHCLQSLGRAVEAMPLYERALAMRQRVYGDRDHPDVAVNLNNLAWCLASTGRADEALAVFEQAHAMLKRLHGDRDHPGLAVSLSNLAKCLHSLGREGEALPLFEQAEAMFEHLHGNRDHPDVAQSLNNLAACLRASGRSDEGLALYERSSRMWKRLYGDADHPYVAGSLNNLAACRMASGRPDEALAGYQEALAMLRRVYGDRDHPDVATTLSNVANCLSALARPHEALSFLEQTLSIRKRLYGDRDHPDVAANLTAVAACLQSLGKPREALSPCVEACDQIERLRGASRLSSIVRQSFFDELKRAGMFERLQALAGPTDVPLAFAAAERSRGRELLDLFEQQRFDPLEEAERRARERGDDRGAERIQQLRMDLDAAQLDDDRLLHLLTSDDSKVLEAERESRRAALLKKSNAVTLRKRQLLEERARLLGDVLPVGRVRTATEIQAALRPGELLLEFTVTEQASLLYVLARDGAPTVVPLPAAHTTAQRVLSELLRRSSQAALRGRDPDASAGSAAEASPASRELFEVLIPKTLWPRLQSSRCVYVAAHRALHRLPFELLVTDVKDGKPVLWIDSGPPISYVASGTVLHWLRHRETASPASLDVLVVGDPRLGDTKPPELGPGAEPARFVRHDDLERLSKLPQLKGARAEAETIAAAFTSKDAKADLLLGEKATEPAVFDLASQAKYLHFACHGVAEEYAGQSLSMLVLTQPKDVQPGDDGFLKLTDLFHSWSGRLAACRLVTLSACRTNVGGTGRDEAPQALPLGFLFAGAPAVISSLWAVDDASTKELMVDFYSRLLAGETDQLLAFTAAKKALRAKYPDPFHWAPFLYMGSPD